MTIEVEEERLAKARERALRKLSPKARVPGFRPGKAPPNMVRQYFGEERILDEALDELVPAVYREAIEADESIWPVARPQLVVETTDPLIVKATIPVRPTVELGDYPSIRVEMQQVTFDDQRIDDTLLALQRRAATLEPHEREIGWRDVLRIELEASVGDDVLVAKQEAEIQLAEERDVLFPGFEEQLLGRKKSDALEFDLEVPAGVDDEKFGGKQAHFTVQVLETKAEVLPELDEEFLKSVGEGYESLGALRERIGADIKKREEEMIVDTYHDQILNQLVEMATIEYPAVMVEAEIDRMLHDQFGHMQHEGNFPQYLASIGRDVQQLRDEYRPLADTRLRRSLALAQVTEAEGIDVDDADLSAEIVRLSVAAGAQGPQFEQLFGSAEGRATVRRNLLTRRALARLVEIATEGAIPAQQAADASADTASAEDLARETEQAIASAAEEEDEASEEEADGEA